MIALTAPGVVTERDLYQVWTVSQSEVAGVGVQTVVIECQDLQWLQLAERGELDVIDQIPVEVELTETCRGQT